MKIAVFSLGSAIRYRRNLIQKIDGSYDYWITLWSLARNSDIEAIYVLSRSDYDKASAQDIAELDPRGVIVDVWSRHRDFLRVTGSKDPQSRQMEVVTRLERIMREHYPEVDFGIGFNSQGFDTKYVIPGITRTLRAPHNYNRVFEMALNYTSPLVHYLNTVKIPWFMISIDYRYLHPVMQNVHTCNYPKEIISHKDQVIQWKSIETYEKDSPITVKEVPASASGYEIMGVVGQKITDPGNDRSRRFVVLVTQNSQGYNPNDLRYTILKEWVIEPDTTGESIIHGKWQKEYTEGHPQFKGFLPSMDMVDELFQDTRYTLIMPNAGGWITFKHYEMLVHGVVPFFHPKYDEDFQFVPQDHFIRVSSPEEMYEKMDVLDRNPKARIQLIQELQKTMDGISDGRVFARILNRAFKRTGLPFMLTESTSQAKSKVSNALF